MRVRDLMTAEPITVSRQMPVVEARNLMLSRRFRHLLVVEGGRLVGIVTDRDIRLTSRPRKSSRPRGEICPEEGGPAGVTTAGAPRCAAMR